jgi:hypothetical protein
MKKEDRAYTEGRRAADRGECGTAPYEPKDWRLGFAWIAGWEERMGEIEMERRMTHNNSVHARREAASRGTPS